MSFGSGGTVDYAAPGFFGTSISKGGKFQLDGKMVLAGSVATVLSSTSPKPKFAVFRFNPDGSPDVGFGTGGLKVVALAPAPWNGISEAVNIQIQPDGKLMIGGAGELGADSLGPMLNRFWALVRLRPNGDIDGTFGNNGVANFPQGAPSGQTIQGYGTTLALQPDGKILGLGTFMRENFQLARFTTEGNLDASFGVGGKAVDDAGGNLDYPAGIAIQADGKVIIGGTFATLLPSPGGRPFAANNFVLFRYTKDGTPDASFGVGGRVITDWASTSPVDLGTVNSIDEAGDLELLADGRFLLGGTMWKGGGQSFAIARYLGPGSFSMNSSSVREGDSGTTDLNLEITLDEPPLAPVTVNYETVDGTAVAGQDYQSTNGTAAFAAGQKRQTVSVKVLGDAVAEPDETFTMKLTGSPFGGIANQLGTGTILNDDGPAPPAPGAPVLDSIIPNSGDKSGGTAVAIAGRNLDGVTQVSFGPNIIPADRLTSAAAGEIRLVTPSHGRAEPVSVTVTTSKGISNPLTFTYTESLLPGPLDSAKRSGSDSPSGGLGLNQKALAAAPGPTSSGPPPPLSVPSAISGPVGSSSSLSVTNPIGSGAPSLGDAMVPSSVPQLSGLPGLAAGAEETARGAVEHAMVRRVSHDEVWPGFVLAGLSLLGTAGCMACAARRWDEHPQAALRAACG
ncbi:MAG: Calx-beta domain-containing protein [Actinomycetota bacterium]